MYKKVDQLWMRELSVNYDANAKSRVNVGDRLRDCRTEIYRLETR